MPMPVFDKQNNAVMLEVGEIFSIQKDGSRKIMVIAENGEYYLPSTIEEINLIMNPFGFLLIDKNNVINAVS